MPQFDLYTYYTMILGNSFSFIIIYFLISCLLFILWGKFFFINSFKLNKSLISHFLKLIKYKKRLNAKNFKFLFINNKKFNEIKKIFIFFLNNRYYITVNVLSLKEYNYFFFFLIISYLLSTLLFYIADKINKKNFFYHAKVSSYECGFEAFSDSRAQTTIHFYLIALLFVIFDVEVIYFLPWVTNFYFLNLEGYITMFVFTLLLIIGFAYEWLRGVFEWPSSVLDFEKNFIKLNNDIFEDLKWNNKQDYNFFKSINYLDNNKKKFDYMLYSRDTYFPSVNFYKFHFFKKQSFFFNFKIFEFFSFFFLFLDILLILFFFYLVGLFF